MLSKRSLVLLATVFVIGVSSVAAQTVYPTGTTIWDSANTWSGYTVFATPDGKAVCIDMQGNVVNSWSSPVAGDKLFEVEPLDKGHIIAISVPPGSVWGQTVVELDWNGNLVWSYTLPPGGGEIHHDVERLPNGNTLLLCSQTIHHPPISRINLIDDYLLEVGPGGDVHWSWFTYQHFAEFGFSQEAWILISKQGGDWAHTNSAAALPPNKHTDPALRAGNIVVSQRYTNTVFIIDKATGRIAWQVGPDNNVSHGQHAAHMIEMGYRGEGNIMVFDNGAGTGYPLKGRAPGFSRALEIDPTTHQGVWDYNAGRTGLFSRLFFSDIVSNAQRLRNGNTFICSGVKGRLFEVSPSGAIVWEYMSPYVGTVGGNQLGTLIYRAFRVPYSFKP